MRVGEERFSLGLDVCGIDGDHSGERRARNFIVSLLRIAPSKRHSMPDTPRCSIRPAFVYLKVGCTE